MEPRYNGVTLGPRINGFSREVAALQECKSMDGFEDLKLHVVAVIVRWLLYRVTDYTKVPLYTLVSKHKTTIETEMWYSSRRERVL